MFNEDSIRFYIQNCTDVQGHHPEVESIRVEVRPTGEGFALFRHGAECLEVYSADSIPAVLDCRDPRCCGGGLDLDRLIRWSVVEPRQTEFETVMSCRGYEGSPKGRRKDGPRYGIPSEGESELQTLIVAVMSQKSCSNE